MKIKQIGVGVSTIAAFALFAVPAYAGNDRNSMGSCPHPGGNKIAGYDHGQHAIAGEGMYSGADYVYQVSEHRYVQCFCPDGSDGNMSGIQTNWVHDKDLSKGEQKQLAKSGYFYINDGAGWGLPGGGYFVKNIRFECQSGDCLDQKSKDDQQVSHRDDNEDDSGKNTHYASTDASLSYNKSFLSHEKSYEKSIERDGNLVAKYKDELDHNKSLFGDHRNYKSDDHEDDRDYGEEKDE